MKTTLTAPFGICLIAAFISNAEGNRGYSYADCTYVEGEHTATYYGRRCFCYTTTGIKWKDFWSTFQVDVKSKEDVLVMFPMEQRNCHDAENFLTLSTCLMEHYWPFSVQKQRSLDIPLTKEEVYFTTKSPGVSSEYTLHVSNQRFNKMRFFIFLCGLALFFCASSICRNSLVFCISGALLGSLSFLVFLLLVMRSFVPKRRIFVPLLVAASGTSYLITKKVINEWDEVMTHYQKEVLGYLLLSGFLSFMVCCRLGPVTNKRTLTLMTWALQIVGTALACHGVTYSPVSWLLLGFLLSLKILPLSFTIILGIFRQAFLLLSSVLCWVLGWRSPKSRLLTEEEYREQTEKHTKASLEELRNLCNNRDFPAWDTVLRLRSPQRFAEFLRSGDHVMASERQSHAEQDESWLSNSTYVTAADDHSEDELSTPTHSAPSAFPPPPPFCLPPSPAPSPASCPYPPTLLFPEPQSPDEDDPF